MSGVGGRWVDCNKQVELKEKKGGKTILTTQGTQASVKVEESLVFHTKAMSGPDPRTWGEREL